MVNVTLTQRQLAAISNALTAMDAFYYDEMRATADSSDEFKIMSQEADATESALHVIAAHIVEHNAALAAAQCA